MAEARLDWRHRLWRWLPPRRRRAALRALGAALAPRPGAAPAAARGLIVAGELSRPTGLVVAARLYRAAAGEAGCLAGSVELGVFRRASAAALPSDAALLLCANAPSLPLMLARADKALLRGRRVIGQWAWELERVPPEWRAGLAYVHEVWACSRFTAAALEPILPGRVRVVPYPVAAIPAPPVRQARRQAGLPDGPAVTLVVFGYGSSFARKNPLGAVAAFRQAFGDRADQLLVIKSHGAAAFPAEAAALRAAVNGAGNIVVLDGDWPAERMAALLAAADIVLSLHRAEGFGLVPAQAMLRGIPVIATGWSGNMDFMDEASAAIVGYRLVPMQDGSGVYEAMPGAVWAEPDTGHAADWLRRLGDDPALRATLGVAGRAKAAPVLAPSTFRAALAAAGLA